MQQRSSLAYCSLSYMFGLLFFGACADAVESPAVLDAMGVPVESGIIDGKKSTSGDYPATGVMLFTTERDDGSELGSMLCSGTLIEPDVVMVAAHCNLALFVEPDNPIDYYFSFALDVSEFGDDGMTLPKATYKVASMVPHPDFSLHRVRLGLRRANDIALLFLEKPVEQVEPASLIRAEEASQIEAGAEVTIVGYGRRHNQQRRNDSGVKYHGTTRINRVARWEMQISKGSPQPHKCHGDSGGPTYMRLGKTAGEERLALVGITSHAYDNEDCLHGGVDTRIDPYLDWVQQTMRDACEDGTRPACPK